MAIDTLNSDLECDKTFYVYLYRDPRPKNDNKRALLNSAVVKAKSEAGKARSRLDPNKQSMWAAKRAAMLAGNKSAWADPIKRAARLASMKAARERNNTKVDA